LFSHFDEAQGFLLEGQSLALDAQIAAIQALSPSRSGSSWSSNSGPPPRSPDAQQKNRLWTRLLRRGDLRDRATPLLTLAETRISRRWRLPLIDQPHLSTVLFTDRAREFSNCIGAAGTVCTQTSYASVVRGKHSTIGNHAATIVLAYSCVSPPRQTRTAI
jgi:hypothetical protein